MRVMLLGTMLLFFLLAACSPETLTGGTTVADVSTLTITVRSENGSMLYGADIYIDGEYKGRTSEFGDTAGTKKVVLQGRVNELRVEHRQYHPYENAISAVPGEEQSFTVVLERRRSSYLVQVRDEEGELPRARVSLYAHSGLVESAQTDEEGEAFFEELSDGNYTIRVSKEGYQPVSTSEEITYISDEEIRREVELVRLPELAVMVRSDDTLLPDAEVALYEREEFHAPNAYPLNSKSTRQDGKVIFNHIEYDTAYVLVVKRDGFESEEREFTLTPEQREMEFDLAVLQ